MAVDFETLSELITDARTERNEVHERLVVAEAEVVSLRDREKELIAEEDAYVSTLNRRFPDQPVDLEPISSEEEDDEIPHVNWSTLARTEAVERAIRELTSVSETASPGEIEMLLRQRGRTDTRDAVGGALAHLNRTNKIRSAGRAKWELLTLQS